MWFNLPSKRERQAVLREYNPTNYSVVNMRTIDSVSHPFRYTADSVLIAT